MGASKRSGHASVAETYDYHKGRTGCGDVAAALLTLADVLREMPADSATSIKNGLDAVSPLLLLAGESAGGRVNRTEPVARSNAPVPTASNGSVPGLRTKRRAPRQRTGGKTASGQTARARSNYNHADLRVLGDFLPAAETSRLADSLGASGVGLGDEPNMQELLTLVVHYVTRVRKTVCSHSHIHTVLKKIGVGTPGDLGARLRDVARRRGYVDPSNGQDVRLTTKGANWVDIELPKRKADAKAGER